MEWIVNKNMPGIDYAMRHKSINEYDWIYNGRKLDNSFDGSEEEILMSLPDSYSLLSIVNPTYLVIYRLLRSKYLFINPPENYVTIGLVLLHTGCLTVPQINLLGLYKGSKNDCLYRMLNKHICKDSSKEGLFISQRIVPRYNDRIYMLTGKGYQTFISLLPELYSNEHNLKRDFQKNSYHNICLNDIYAFFLRDKYSHDFRWYYSPALQYGTDCFSLLGSKSYQHADSRTLRPDALFMSLVDKDRYVFIEQDMCTERADVLYKKLSSYSMLIKNSYLSCYKLSILFSIHADIGIIKTKVRKHLSVQDSHSTLHAYFTNMESVRFIQEKGIIYNMNNLDDIADVICTELSSMENSNVRRPVLLKYRKSIEMIKYAVGIGITTLNDLIIYVKNEINHQKDKQSSKEQESLLNVAKNLYANRFRTILNGLLPDDTHAVHEVYYLCLQGFSIYVCDNVRIKVKLPYFMFTESGAYNRYLHELICSTFLNRHADFEFYPHFMFTNGNRTFTFRNHLVEINRKPFVTNLAPAICIENISFDIGGYIRILDFCMNYQSDDTHLDLIVMTDDINEVKKICMRTGIYDRVFHTDGLKHAKNRLRLLFYCSLQDETQDKSILKKPFIFDKDGMFYQY